MNNRIFNFSAGPAVLPLAVLQEAQQELLNYQNTGMSVLEMSHRSKPYEAINTEAEANMKELLGLGDDYRVLFIQGGASTQFAMIPMNFLTPDRTADYILTGAWSEKAQKEAKLYGKTHVAATTADGNYKRIPGFDEIKLSDNPAYVHITSNNTIFGTQWQNLPAFDNIPLIADMSSDMLSRPFNAKDFAMIYAGAQKNLGPAGVTVVVIRKDLLENNPKTIPTMLRYATHSDKDSLYNTPPSFAVYIVNLVLRWLKGLGGLAAIEKMNKEKAALIYDVIDQSNGFYNGHADKDSRSLMNVTFRLPSEELEKSFVSEATAAGLNGLKGHRSVGGLRASIYNAMPKEGCEALRNFMIEFQKKNS
ncbi:Phosphoserine aminotransferase [bioreactor metagenome]|uniref:phosphoserine transaminase n=1 Tax=bioreactor metagenome TaxID=1076179 RepID=A0A644SV30_9ZZZZ|nr:3-phosphoserine/phosphohydroxythreonine transaminase [Negativicutes bacterium]